MFIHPFLRLVFKNVCSFCYLPVWECLFAEQSAFFLPSMLLLISLYLFTGFWEWRRTANKSEVRLCKRRVLLFGCMVHAAKRHSGYKQVFYLFILFFDKLPESAFDSCLEILSGGRQAGINKWEEVSSNTCLSVFPVQWFVFISWRTNRHSNMLKNYFLSGFSTRFCI